MPLEHRSTFGPYLIRSWQPSDRDAAANLIAQVLQEYSLTCEPTASDRDAQEVEACYWETGGEFWVVEAAGKVVGTVGYRPTHRGDRPQKHDRHRAVELRKMYLLPQARGQGLGRYLLTTVEAAIRQRGFDQIWLETASVLKAAVRLYEANGYKPTSGVETARCDRVYCKRLTATASSTT
ncbi:GNAT family N-acetyltransferase [Nodosilinea sp. LEGE 07088]|uniref:GNAT family N-acetyltransferase n=1 Tax=Nodosilinea sp. LEGE 07088 TaxID=2777968 RepID=UPI00188260DF|nr:GNAT family N-acetyltransferase [Nodosilinea sp. LEGE 07088]MBE9138731.1 GNAT family N-acetyltransferase [Nodosilinea sp. LEGE 07088]